MRKNKVIFRLCITISEKEAKTHNTWGYRIGSYRGVSGKKQSKETQGQKLALMMSIDARLLQTHGVILFITGVVGVGQGSHLWPALQLILVMALASHECYCLDCRADPLYVVQCYGYTGKPVDQNTLGELWTTQFTREDRYNYTIHTITLSITHGLNFLMVS